MAVALTKFLLVSIILVNLAYSQEEAPATILTLPSPEPSTADTTSPEGEGNSKFQFLNNKTFIKDPFNLRDPFRKVEASKKIKSDSRFKVDKNTFSNVKALGDVNLDNLAIVGIFVGKERRALAKIKTGETLGAEVYIIKEGMTIGSGSAEVKAILPGGIAIVEKITNVYNQDEYIETIIPVYSD